jgi:hypothetical protein
VQHLSVLRKATNVSNLYLLGTALYTMYRYVPHFSLLGMVHNVEYFPLLGIVQYALYSIPLYWYCLIYTAFFCARNNTICTASRSIKNSAPCTVFRQFTTTLLLGTVRTIYTAFFSAGNKVQCTRSLSTKKSTPFTFGCSYSI